MIPQNKTKIVATIGPASGDKKILSQLIDAGLDVARFNFSHGEYDIFEKWLGDIRALSKKKNQYVAVLQDLQGPRIRIGDVPRNGLFLKKGEITKVGFGKYRKGFLPIDYKGLIKDIKKGTRLMLVDGLVELEILSKGKTEAKARVISDGFVFPRKGVNIPNAKLSIASLTKKDIEDLNWGVDHDVDFIGLSFVREAKDIKFLRKLILKRNPKSKIKIIAKIEKPQALENIKSILHAADGVMVARGDLGIELPPEKVPTAQKKIIMEAIEIGKPVITATQMMESMVGSVRPTRAEVSDVANAILDGTDAVMLSEETAMGKYPVKAVEMMTRIAKEIEKQVFKTGKLHFENINREDLKKIKESKKHIASADAVGESVNILSQELKAKYIVAATLSGYSARMVSRARPKTPILGASPKEKTLRQMALVWGVRSFYIPVFKSADDLIKGTANMIKKQKLGKKKDKVVVVCSHPIGKSGDTNLVKIEEVR